MLRLDLDLCAVNLGVRRSELPDTLGKFYDDANTVQIGLDELRHRTQHVPDDIMRRDLTLADSCVRAVIDQLAWVRRQSIDEAM